jgi:hypothetical protein
MGNLPLFIEADLTRDRALGMVWGAACGVRAGYQGSSWPSGDDMLTHLSESLVQDPSFDIQDVLRRLIRAWAQRAGRPTLTSVTEPINRTSTVGFVAGLVPICIVNRTGGMAAQARAAELAMTFGALPAEGEALELMTRYLVLALLGLDRAQSLQPLSWEGGDPRVRRVAAGLSLPIETRRDLVAAIDQARGVAMRRIPMPAAFAALAVVNASEAAYILGGALIGALDGSRAFPAGPYADRVNTRSATLERIVDQLLVIDQRHHPRRVLTDLPS